MAPKIYFIHLKCRGNKIYNMSSENISALRLGHSSIKSIHLEWEALGFIPRTKQNFFSSSHQRDTILLSAGSMYIDINELSCGRISTQIPINSLHKKKLYYFQKIAIISVKKVTLPLLR